MNKRAKKKPQNRPFLSLVIPAYKAEKTIEKTLLQVKNVMDLSNYSYEIICVVDGKEDDTYKIAKRIARKFPRKIRVVGYLINLGKGHAVRFGMARAKGEIIGFVDVGLDLKPEGLTMLLSHLEWYDADIVIGSKRHPVSKVSYPWQRRILSSGYQLLVRILFGLRVRDTQVGMKFFRREVLEKTLPRLLVKAWAFDVEMLAVAYDLGFKRIYEAPVETKMEFGGKSVLTSGKFWQMLFFFLIDTMAIFYRLKILKYYDWQNRKNWVTPNYLVLNKK